MASFNQRLKALRLSKELSQQVLADKIGISKSSVNMYERGEREPGIETLEAFADFFNVDMNYLLGKDDVIRNRIFVSYRSDSHDHTLANNPSIVTQIPVFGSVAAGIPIEAITDIEDYEEITEDLARTGEFAALRIKGNSMEPKFSAGDVVIVRLQENADNGDIAIVLVNGDEATCKKIKRTPEGIMLISTNPAYEPMFYSNRDIEEKPVRIWGKVIELRAKF